MNCQQKYKQWVGKCSTCNEWNTVETIVNELSNVKKLSYLTMKERNTSQINSLSFDTLGKTNDEQNDTAFTHSAGRYVTTISELDRVLGGGFVCGTTVLIAGEPGIGKSTLLLQLCNAMASDNLSTCYISGEESTGQIKVRANRMNIVNSNVKLITTTSLDEIILIINNMKAPGVVVIDSIQTVVTDDVGGMPGTISQVKACTLELVNTAKTLGICLILVGHINKEGQIAGPKLLEHMVDVVLLFEADNTKQYRLIRGIKNRYGSTNEVGIFEMSNTGLLEVTNPSRIFMPENRQNISGSCVFAGIEGTRGILVEVQALVVPSFLPTPRRAAIGWDNNRLSMMIAILNARMGVNMMDKEVYLNVAGGMKINDPGLDLAVAVALVSAYKNIIISHDTAFFGEVGLLGELRSVSHIDVRVKECKKLGFKTIVTSVYSKCDSDDICVYQIRHIREIAKLLNK